MNCRTVPDREIAKTPIAPRSDPGGGHPHRLADRFRLQIYRSPTTNCVGFGRYVWNRGHCATRSSVSDHIVIAINCVSRVVAVFSLPSFWIPVLLSTLLSKAYSA